VSWAEQVRIAAVAPRATAASRLAVEGIVAALVTLVAAGLVTYPMGWLVWGALHHGAPGEGGALTWSHFTGTLGSAAYWLLVLRSLLVGAGATLLATAIGLPLAWLTVRTDMPCRGLVEVAAILPFFTSTFVGALAWIFLGNPTNGLLRLWTGLPVNIYSLGGIVWVTGLYMSPYVYLFTAAALRNLDATYEEASFMARGGRLRTLAQVTIPLIAPALLSAMSLVLIISLDIFGVAAILGFPARISLLATEVFVKATVSPVDYGGASVAGLTLVVIASALLMLQRRFLGRRSYAVLGGRGFRGIRYRLGAWRLVALAGALLYALFAVVLPFLVLLKTSLQTYPTPHFTAWTLANWQTMLGDDGLIDSLRRSLVLSVSGATAAVLFTATIAWLVHRSRSRLMPLLDYVASFPIGIPGIVMGLGMMWAYITWPIWGTVWLLAVAYVTLFMPYGVRALGATIVQIHPELEESSRVHRGTWLRTLCVIVLPLLRSGVWSTWMLLFVILIREISTAVLLTSVHTQLFPVFIFQQWTGGDFGVMSAGALLLSGLMIAVVVAFRLLFRAGVMPS
jgi:iron(III) transport system permease protein